MMNRESGERNALLEACKKQEARHRKTIEVLERTIDHFRSLAELSPDCIFIIDREFCIQYANGTALRFLRKSPEQAIGRHLAGFFPPETYRGQERHLRRVFGSGAAVTSTEHFSFPDIDLFLNTKWIPVKEVSGKIESVLCISRDISELETGKTHAPGAGHPGFVLSKREKEILGLIAEGMTNRQIGEKLFISPRTVDTHRGRIMKKLEARNVADLIRKSSGSGLLK